MTLIRTAEFSGAWAVTIARGDRRVHFRHGSLYELGEHRAQVFGEELHSGAFSGKAPDFWVFNPGEMAQGSGETTVSVMLISASGSSRLCWPGEKLQSVVPRLAGNPPLRRGSGVFSHHRLRPKFWQPFFFLRVQKERYLRGGHKTWRSLRSKRFRNGSTPRAALCVAAGARGCSQISSLFLFSVPSLRSSSLDNREAAHFRFRALTATQLPPLHLRQLTRHSIPKPRSKQAWSIHPPMVTSSKPDLWR